MPIMESHLSSEVTRASSSPDVPQLCYGCGLSIQDRWFLCVSDRSWHTSCLQCSHCKNSLDQQVTCFTRSGRIYCKEDYYRLFAVRQCSRCNVGIYATDMVMRVRGLVFHTHCFNCAWCNASLPPGHLFGVRDDLVYCRLHYEAISAESDFTTSLGPGADFEEIRESAISPLQYSPASPLQQQQQPAKKGRPRKKKVDPEYELQALQAPLDCQMSPGGTMSPLSTVGEKIQLTGQQRTKRMRTSFKHHQLRTMKSYFSLNQNPDTKDLKQLAQKTGLSKRVLQVWFQNARAKWRRNNLRNHDPSAPMVTQPPTTLPQSPGEISSFSEASPLSTSNPLDFAQQQALVATVETTFQELF